MILQLAPTLLDSYDFLQHCPDSWKSSAFSSLYSTLARKWGGTTPQTTAGIEFESTVYRLSRMPLDVLAEQKLSDELLHCVNRVRGKDFQKRVEYHITVDGQEYFFVCKLDVFAKDEIIDIKTTGKFKGNSTYLSKWQHRIYTLATEVPKFVYLVAEWENLHDSHRIKEVHEVPFDASDTVAIEGQIAEHIREFMDFLSYDDELKNLYYTRYNKKA